jgi:octaprenyl-diphosphate synthase
MGTVHALRQKQLMREVFAAVQPKLAEVDSFLDREVSRAVPMVGEVAGYVLGSGGKRVRPALLLLVSRMLAYSGERDVRYGAVVEMLHSATLMHDDIIDEADVRRGRPTANRKFGTHRTVLVGDWLFAWLMRLCLEVGDVQVMRTLTAATLAMTEGEILAEEMRRSLDVREDVYMDITRRKTAELFAATCSVPALFQASTLHLTEQLASFGRNLGICFQLVDDALDYSASRRELGKPVMADLREGRLTLPMILLLPRLDSARRKLVRTAVETGALDTEGEQELLEAVRTSGVLEATRQRAQTYADRAIEEVHRFPAGDERDMLLKATEFLVDRRS